MNTNDQEATGPSKGPYTLATALEDLAESLERTGETNPDDIDLAHYFQNLREWAEHEGMIVDPFTDAEAIQAFRSKHINISLDISQFLQLPHELSGFEHGQPAEAGTTALFQTASKLGLVIPPQTITVRGPIASHGGKVATFSATKGDSELFVYEAEGLNLCILIND